MTERTPVLAVDTGEGLGGGQEVLLTLLGRLDRSRFSVVLAANAGPLAEEAARAGVEVITIRMPELRFGGRGLRPAAPLSVRSVGRALSRAAKRSGVRVFHGNGKRAGVYAAAGAEATDLPLVWHCHNVHRGASERIYAGRMCRRASGIVCVSEAAASALPCRSRADVVPNGVDPSRFDPAATGDAIRSEWGIPRDALVVGTLGRLDPAKGIHSLMQAASRLKSHRNLWFAAVGDAGFPRAERYAARLRRLARDLGVSERFLFPGRLAPEEALAALDVFVYAGSSVHDDAAPLAVLEAMAMQRAVVAFASGGVPEQVGDAGVLVESRGPDALAAAIEPLLADPQRRSRLGERARARVEHEFPIGRMVEGVQRAWEEAAAVRPGGGGAG